MFECALAFIFSRVLITFHHRSYHLNSGNFEFNRHFVRQIFFPLFYTLLHSQLRAFLRKLNMYAICVIQI